MLGFFLSRLLEHHRTNLAYRQALIGIIIRNSSQPDALDLIEHQRQAFLGTIVELGGAGALVRGHRLGVLERPRHSPNTP
jgi:hypothetical protein